ncbi:hypothetical protein RFI_16336, partial [Reticulomyxa filosa]
EAELEDLKKQVEDINTQVKDMIQKIDAIKQASGDSKTEMKTEAKTDSTDSSKPKDRFLEVMESFAQDARKSAEDLQAKLKASLDNMASLAVAFGESKDIKLEDLIKYFTDFLESWGKSREALRKIEAEKKKKENMEAKKNKLQEKLVKRESKQALQDKGVLKSKKKAKQEKQQKKLVENVLTKEINEKKKRILELEGKEKKLKLAGRHISICVQQIKYYCLHCQELHDDAMQRSGQYLHKCWVNPEAKENRDELKGKQLRWFSMMEKMDDCEWQHEGPCIQQNKSENVVLAGIQVVRDEENQRKRGDENGPINKDIFRSGAITPNTLTRIRKEKAGSGGTVHSLLGRTHSGKIETGSGNEIATKRNYRDVQIGFIDWRKKFDPESAVGLAMKITPLLEEEEMAETPLTPDMQFKTQKPMKQRGSRELKEKGSASDSKNSDTDEEPLNKYIKRVRKRGKKQQKKVSFEKERNPAKPNENPRPNVKGLKGYSISVENEEGDKQVVVTRDGETTTPLDEHGGALGKSSSGHRSRESKFIPGSTLEESRRLKRRGSDASSPRHNKRRSTIENNVHAETFRVTNEQKEKLEDSDFLKQLRDDFINYGQLTKEIGQIDGRTKENQKGEVDNGDGEIRKFILHEEQIQMLHDEEYMTQVVKDFDHFGTINVHESELILQCREKSKVIDAVRKLEKRLGVLWARAEIQEIMNTLHVTWDDDDHKMLKFLDKMTKQVQHGARFNKHRKKGAPEHRWVLVKFGRLFWKERVSDKNHKSHSFNLTKVKYVAPGKVTRALQDAKDVPEGTCFSVASDSVTLDLQAESEDVANEWVNYLRGYVRHYAEQGRGPDEKGDKEREKGDKDRDRDRGEREHRQSKT